VESNERLYVYFILPTNTVRGAPAFLQSKSQAARRLEKWRTRTVCSVETDHLTLVGGTSATVL
jgi:hypothetical protein